MTESKSFDGDDDEIKFDNAVQFLADAIYNYERGLKSRALARADYGVKIMKEELEEADNSE